MAEKKTCCGAEPETGDVEYEIARIRKVKAVCSSCEDYAAKQASKPVAVMSCEGGCLRGEVSRQAANVLCHKLARDKTVRICLGGAFTKDTGQRNLVRNAPRVLALEGCFLHCSTRMMQGVIEGLEPEIIVTDKLFDFDTSIFGIDEMPREEIDAHAMTVARKVAEKL